MKVHIRWIIKRDMQEVFDIENDSFEFPWSEEDFTRVLRQRNAIGMVAGPTDEEGKIEQVVGFMIYELHRTRLHLLNFAVAKDFRRLGIGRQMFEKIQTKLSPQRRSRVLFEVREANLEGQLFLRTMKWKAVSVLRRYYDRCDDCNEDAYLFQYKVYRAPVTLGPLEGLA